jgi:selenocysteine-specific elongation factor
VIVATAGHVDHGKTALVKALTGIDTDRLPQEKARGISIDLGFAYLATPAGATLGFVDVPGHERFVRNMLAGVYAIDCVVLVVAADDGVMPQTREHLAIVDLMAVTRGIVVVSKIDCVAPARVAEVRAEAARLVAATGLRDAPVVEVSALRGDGIDALRRMLQDAADAHVLANDARRGFRYVIDRAFSVAGSGTVVTGTVCHGNVAVGDRLVLTPSGAQARVRGIQKAGAVAQSARAGERCALNLAGVERHAVARGQWVASEHAPTTRLDVTLGLLADVPQPLRHWSPVQLHIGTADVAAHIASRGVALAPGATAIVQLVCEEPVSAVTGDRFIVRNPAAMRTLGGGVVLDPCPAARRPPRALRAAQLDAMALLDPEHVLPALLAASPGGVDVAQFGRAFGLVPAQRDLLVRQADAAVIAGDPPRAWPVAFVDRVKNDSVMTLARFHEASPQAPGMELAALRRQIAPALDADTFATLLHGAAAGLDIEIVGSVARRLGHVTTANKADEVLWQRVKPRLVEAGARGELVRDLADDLRVRESVLVDFLHRKARSGDVVRVSPQRFYPRQVLAALAALATAMAGEVAGGAFTAAQFRDRSGVNRMLAIEILECLDRLGVTQRVGDARKIRKDFAPILGPASPLRATLARQIPAPVRASRVAHAHGAHRP